MLCHESLKSLKNMPSDHNCLKMKIFPVKSFFSYSEGDKRGQWWNRSTSLCASARLWVCLHWVEFFSLSWHQLIYRNIQQIPTGDSLLLSGCRKNNNYWPCVFHWSVALVPDSRLGCLPQSGETRGRIRYPETQKGFPYTVEAYQFRVPNENNDRAICYSWSWDMEAVVPLTQGQLARGWYGICYIVIFTALLPVCISAVCTLPHADSFLFSVFLYPPAPSEVWKSEIRGTLKTERQSEIYLDTSAKLPNSWALPKQTASHSGLWREADVCVK